MDISSSSVGGALLGNAVVKRRHGDKIIMELSTAYRVMPPVERKTLDMFRPGM